MLYLSMTPNKTNGLDLLTDKLTDIMAGFLGSWAAVLFHAVWFFFWLYWRLSINLLTLIVSLEAIYMCIFLLMAANKEERIRVAREAEEKKIDRSQVETDLKLDQKADRQLTEIKRLQKELHAELKQVKRLCKRP